MAARYSLAGNGSVPMSNANLIIGGVSKSGTTSVFRYLSRHPQIRASIRKELSFFFVNRSESADKLRTLYEQKFEPARDVTGQVSLEASPRYLQDGTEVAVAIQRAFPDARLLFLLRDPTDRLISYFKSKHKQGTRVGTSMTFDEFVELALGTVNSPLESLAPEFVPIRTEIERGYYAEQIMQYVDVFPVAQLMIGFYDSLRHDTAGLMKAVSEFAGIDANFYEDFDFTIENKSRAHRWSSLRRLAGQVNLRLEPWLNKAPALKQRIRALYDFVNVDEGRDIEVGSGGRQKLQLHYRSRNRALYELLSQMYPSIGLPGWLRDEARDQG